jgi:hypothetical protein
MFMPEEFEDYGGWDEDSEFLFEDDDPDNWIEYSEED